MLDLFKLAQDLLNSKSDFSVVTHYILCPENAQEVLQFLNEMMQLDRNCNISRLG